MAWEVFKKWRKRKQPPEEWELFDAAMRHMLTVTRDELDDRLEKDGRGRGWAWRRRK